MVTIRVGISQLSVAKSPDNLETQALGSCVAVVLYDPHVRLGGLAHVMLPNQESAKESSRGDLTKFANTATQALFSLMLENGARRSALEAKLVGGANMFPDISKLNTVHIGRRNTEAAKAKLAQLKIPVVAEDTGGSLGRSIVLDTSTGLLLVRTIRFGEKVI
ncbi:MAG: hypothetical protein ACD_62C00606G0002 [uncultured bacterium]|nr:MAG: hypothetical protein ACD_62C00606G0002 [uncultured bacterium]